MTPFSVDGVRCTMSQLSPNSIKTILLLSGLTGLLLYFGQAYGGQSGLLIALLCALVINFGTYWFSDKIILSLYRAKAVRSDEQPQLYATTAYLAERANIPRPALYVIDEATPNAFATGRSPEHAAIAVTTGMLSLLSKDELAGVIAHELAHVQHRDTLLCCLAACIGGAISILANIIQWTVMFGMGRKEEAGRHGKFSLMVMSMIAPMLAVMIQMAISRSREFAADEKAASLCGDAMWLANALRKLDKAREENRLEDTEHNPATAHLFIINPLHNKQWSLLFATHPPIGERIHRLESLGY